ncbi:YjbH domain-containing protein [Loktanella salsilacus]|nr:YjbH domain-containing protein [Loktanella salsilacus]
MMRRLVGQTALLTIIASMTAAQDNGPSYTIFGTPGLLEMPTAESAAPDDIAATIARSPSGGTRTSFTYQITPRLSGSFRYGNFDQYGEADPVTGDRATFETFDRSFDLQYRFNTESRYIPAIAVGLRDFLGTGRFSSEYIVGSKSIGDKIIVTAGLGWGAMGQQNGFSNPLSAVSDYFDTRPAYVDREFAEEGSGDGNGGTLSTNQFFRGDAAVFGGIEYQYSDKLGFKAEYSSINYPLSTFAPAIDYNSPINVGLSYRYTPNVELGAAWMYGSELSLRGTYILNPTDRQTASGLDTAPAPVRVRTADQRAAATWNRTAQPEPAVRKGLTDLLAIEGIKLVGLEITDRTARLRYENTRFRSEAQAMGRAARMMTQVIPPSVQTFVMEPVQNGLPLSAVTLPRAGIEAAENRVGGTDALLASAGVTAAGTVAGLVTQPDPDPKFQWGIAPYFTLILFNKNEPLDFDTGLALDLEYSVNRNLKLATRVQQTALGAQDPLDFTENVNDYANVRTDSAYFGRDGTPTLEYLTASYYTRLTPDIYGRVTAGYLEQMYGGVSTEVLWKPVASRLAVGAEVNYAMLRDQDMGFGFAQYETQDDGSRVENGDYTVTTANLTGYYDIGRGYHASLGVGKYLAGDVGATFALDREYENGWKVGGYFTLTDMPFDDFGEGSFDKGIRITIPYDYFIGTPSRKSVTTTVQSLTRDGGATLDVQGRLYEVVRDGQLGDLTDTWGRFGR